MLNSYKIKNWKENVPQNIIEYFFTPCGLGLKFANLFFQRILRINGKINFMVHYTSQVNGKIILGKNVAKSFANSGGCYFQGINGIYIGDDTIFAPGVKVISANHSINSLHNHDKEEPILIGKNCWLGANVVILPSVKIGDNVIVAAGAVVTKSFESNIIIGGIPTKIIKYLNE